MKEISITPLGTISPYLKGNMNCPGFLIEYNNKKIILDCGNGITKLLNFPNDLDDMHIFISHYHIDHFGDIGCLQNASYVYHNLGQLDNKINIYIPENDIDFNKQSIVSRKDSYARYYDIRDSDVYYIDDLKISFRDNHSHTIESYMIKLQNDYFKIIYTSDIGTTNLSDVVDFCKDADLIICESSLLKVHNSPSKTHLTAFDAGMIAKEAKSKELLLTHFWPEEEKINYLEEAVKNFKNTKVAFEGKKLILRKNNNI